MLYTKKAILDIIEKARLKDEKLIEINNAMPPEAKYGDVFKAIRDAQIDEIIKEFEK